MANLLHDDGSMNTDINLLDILSIVDYYYTSLMAQVKGIQ